MEKFPVIMLSGRKTSGKDTLAERLCEKHYFSRCAFADYLKRLCSRLLTNLGVELETDMFTDPVKKEKLLLDRNGKPFVFAMKSGRKNMTARQFLQYFGSEVGRDMIHEHMWIIPMAMLIKNVMNDPDPINMNNRGVVITDCRFPNEYSVTKSLLEGTQAVIHTVRIDRPSLPERTDLHISETAMDDFRFDRVIVNDGTIEDLHFSADRLVMDWYADAYPEKFEGLLK